MRGDGIHITGEGYQKWAEAIEPSIVQILGEGARKE